MIVAVRILALVGMLLSFVVTSGCATIVKGSSQDVTISTDPAGASCDLRKSGNVIGNVNPTPGTIQVKKGDGDIEVSCKKKGYADTVGTIFSSLEGWTFGNILLGGVIGVVVDASSGALHNYQPEIFVKLPPEKFASDGERQDFYDNWRNQIMQTSTRAKIEAAKTCSKEQCDEIVKRIDRETEQALAGIEANRNLKKSAASSTQASPAPQATQSDQAKPQTVSTREGPPAADGRWHPNKGDRWKYRMVDGKRAVGTMAIEIIESTSGRVTERITREGSPGFFVEREVQPDFTIAAFVPSVQLPGGYKLVELSAFFPPDSALTTGKIPGQIPGDLELLGVGKRNLVWDARVTGREHVRVPAGEFDAWKIEATTDAESRHGPMRISYQVWYSPAMQRAVKMALYISSPISIDKVSESLELAAFDKAL